MILAVLIFFLLLLLGGGAWGVCKLLLWRESIQKQIFYYKSQRLPRESLMRLANERAEEILEREEELKERVHKELLSLDLVGIQLFYPDQLRDVLEGVTQPLEELRYSKLVLSEQGKHKRMLKRTREEAERLLTKQKALRELEDLKLKRRRLRERDGELRLGERA